MRSLLISFALLISFQSQAAMVPYLKCDDVSNENHVLISIDPDTRVIKTKGNVLDAIGAAISEGTRAKSQSDLLDFTVKGEYSVVRDGKNEQEGRWTEQINVRIINLTKVEINSSGLYVDIEEIPNSNGQTKGQAAVDLDPFEGTGHAAALTCVAINPNSAR